MALKHLALVLIVAGAVTVGCNKSEDSAAPTSAATGAVPTASTPAAPTEDPSKGTRDAGGMPIPGSPDSK